MPRPSDDAAAIVRALVDAWNGHDADEICAFMAEEFENFQAPIGTIRGLDEYRVHLRRWFDAYPDLRLRIDTLFAAGDLVCLETTARGAPKERFFGVEAEASRENRALDILELRDGLVWRQRGYWDFSLWTGRPSPRAGQGAA